MPPPRCLRRFRTVTDEKGQESILLRDLARAVGVTEEELLRYCQLKGIEVSVAAGEPARPRRRQGGHRRPTGRT
jgi:hypothetical protein